MSDLEDLEFAARSWAKAFLRGDRGASTYLRRAVAELHAAECASSRQDPRDDADEVPRLISHITGERITLHDKIEARMRELADEVFKKRVGNWSGRVEAIAGGVVALDERRIREIAGHEIAMHAVEDQKILEGFQKELQAQKDSQNRWRGAVSDQLEALRRDVREMTSFKDGLTKFKKPEANVQVTPARAASLIPYDANAAWLRAMEDAARNDPGPHEIVPLESFIREVHLAFANGRACAAAERMGT